MKLYQFSFCCGAVRAKTRQFRHIATINIFSGAKNIGTATLLDCVRELVPSRRIITAGAFLLSS